ncbi:hypothetical protein J1G44_07660 [Cellulomonas sp. zg-ZUI199]|uniref:Uncharacterized protein n=1 Tax=Cellulomonas wangleii TaxID=2816956 RepID=A0ABX8D4G8_9CELL|nr:hypothetical protein [Cellulomonas wangleii]MBO0924360.1 hypothetical protein [Cellulomonas wangleii]QVI62362.1 hypothetical protein KG103_18505 [Cellulomonas wangleii]
MQTGSVAEWAGAIATLLATVVALYLAARDEDGRRSRLAARRQIRSMAAMRVRELRRLERDEERSLLRDDIGYSQDHVELSRYYDLSKELGWVRRRRAQRVLRDVYGGQAALDWVELYPSVSEDDRAHAAALVLHLVRSPEGALLTKSRLHLALQKPADATKVAELRCRYEVLADL